jgi:trimethylamine:corrinoid methyltransferase-like protein
MDRNAYVIWEKKGSTSMEDRVHEKLSQILSSHQPPELPMGVKEKIQTIIARAEARCQTAT